MGVQEILTQDNASYTYDPWGRVLTSSGTVVNPYRYAGYRYDAVSGLYSCWNRSYAPELGRFLQRDLVPARLAVPETLNRYTYCWGDPVNKVDPTGLACWDTGAFVSGLMLGLTVAVGVVALLVAFPVSAGLLAALAIVGTVGAVYVGVNCAVAVATGHDLLGNVVSAQDASFGLGEVVGSLVGAGVESLATGGGSGAAVDQAPPSGDYVNLASDSRTAHVLSQHMSPGEPGESLFPEDWTAGQIMHHISDIATDPNLTWEQQTGPQGSDFTRAGDPVRYTVDGIRDGVSIRVIVEPRGEGIITGFPRW